MKRGRYTIDADLSECRTCGALVSDEVRHTNWHQQLLLAILVSGKSSVMAQSR